MDYFEFGHSERSEESTEVLRVMNALDSSLRSE